VALEALLEAVRGGPHLLTPSNPLYGGGLIS
jgi:hypothetical protein